MIASGTVVSIRWRRNRWVMEGSFAHDGAERSAPAFLRLGSRVLAETHARADRPRGALRFVFSFSKNLSFLLADIAPLEIRCGEIIATFSEEAHAARAEVKPDPEAIAAFERRIDSGYTLARDGSLQPPVGALQRSMPATLRHYRACDALVKEIAGYNIHVAGGTLLGLLRGGGPIPHDLDFDAAYLSRHHDPALVKDEFVDLVMRLVERGEDVRIPQGNRRSNFAKWFSRKDLEIHLDLFPAYVDDQDFYCRPTFVRIPGGEDLILPLKRMPFGGDEVWAPAEMERKAVAIFGADWATPDVFWRKPTFAGARAATIPLRLTAEEIAAIDSAREAHRPARKATIVGRGVAALRRLAAR